MQELLQDKETLCFYKKGAIDMWDLKKEIDRRVLKIKNMVNGQENLLPVSGLEKSLVQMACQTDNICQKENMTSQKYNKVLTTFNSCVMMPENVKNRSSLPCQGKKNNRRQFFGQNQQHKKRVKVSEYLSSKRSLLHCSHQQVLSISNDSKHEQKQRQIFLQSQDQKVFTNMKVQSTLLQFEHHNSIKTTKSFLAQKSYQKYSKPSNASLQSSDGSIVISFGELPSDDELPQRKSLSTMGKKTASIRKLKLTDRTTVPQLQKRIIVSDECMKKITQMLSKMNRKHRQPADNKLRANIIKRIDEKYGEYYDNI